MPLSSAFNSHILNLPENLATRENYELAIEKMGWKLVEWDEPTHSHDFSPVGVKVMNQNGQEKYHPIVRTKNSATIAVVRDTDIKGEYELLVREEQKATGEVVVTMASGYPSSPDEPLEVTALKKLEQETGIKVTNYIGVPHSAASLPNNSTNTSTSFIARVSKDTDTPDGWRFIPLEDAPKTLTHLPAQTTALFACQYFHVRADVEFTLLENKLEQK